MASAAAKPCQGDSSEFYLITGRIPDGSSCWQETCQFTTPCSHLTFLIKDIMITERPTTQLPQLLCSDACYHDPKKCEHASPKVTTLHGGNTTTRMIKRFTVTDDLK
ncbi:hypothetical protein Tco_1504023 [Tanacetum coccineum]